MLLYLRSNNKVYRLLEEELNLNVSSTEKPEICLRVICYWENDVGEEAESHVLVFVKKRNKSIYILNRHFPLKRNIPLK
jgi:bisphosphoglycerate-dependent phosphoglycerate mutase